MWVPVKMEAAAGNNCPNDSQLVIDSSVTILDFAVDRKVAGKRRSHKIPFYGHSILQKPTTAIASTPH
jgi:hypothetical protein